MSSKRRIEFGDFQTPSALAERVCRLLARRRVRPAAVVEPTCGVGNLLTAALDCFASLDRGLAADVNEGYVRQLRRRLQATSSTAQVQVRQADFFTSPWDDWLAALPQPLLVVGNPPWVNNSQLGLLGGGNLPAKRNAQRLRGIEALTGKSNFDVSQWMLDRLAAALAGKDAVLAMLCKTAVARKVLLAAWENGSDLRRAEMYAIDAAAEFGAAVDACLLVCRFGHGRATGDCAVYPGLDAARPTHRFGRRDGRLVADAARYDRWRHLLGPAGQTWRSGIKHDCAAVMQLRRVGDRFENGLGQRVALEEDYLYPLLKSSQLARADAVEPDRWMLVPQQTVGDDTELIRARAPRTWRYLQAHAERLDRRASSIYRNRPRFSVFGVGPYSFAPWKVAISGLHKRLRFAKVGSCRGKPIVLDDTAYSLSCPSEAEADRLVALLNSAAAHEFFSAFIFWDAKRPVTAEILRLLDLDRLAEELSPSTPVV